MGPGWSMLSRKHLVFVICNIYVFQLYIALNLFRLDISQVSCVKELNVDLRHVIHLITLHH